MANPAKLSRIKFEEIKVNNPKKASNIENRVSGEIYGLYPTNNGYGSNQTIDITYKEGEYVEGAE